MMTPPSIEIPESKCPGGNCNRDDSDSDSDSDDGYWVFLVFIFTIKIA